MTQPASDKGLNSDAAFAADRLLDVALPGFAARLVLIDASTTAFEAEFRHLAGRTAAVTLARAAAGALLLGSDLKNDERLAVQVRAEGPLAGLLVEADARLRFRGYTHKKVVPELDASSSPPTAGLGPVGRLQIIRSTGSQVVYRGVTALRTGDPADDLRAAMEESAQIPTRLWIDHGYERQLTHVVGAMLQAVPGHDAAAFKALAAAIDARVDAARPFPRDLMALLAALMPPDVERRPLGERPVGFACRCSRDKVVAMLKSLGPPEGGGGYPDENRVTCAFCNDVFEIAATDLT
jgi:molecular chaperone Hsp33